MDRSGGSGRVAEWAVSGALRVQESDGEVVGYGASERWEKEDPGVRLRRIKKIPGVSNKRDKRVSNSSAATRLVFVCQQHVNNIFHIILDIYFVLHTGFFSNGISEL